MYFPLIMSSESKWTWQSFDPILSPLTLSFHSLNLSKVTPNAASFLFSISNVPQMKHVKKCFESAMIAQNRQNFLVNVYTNGKVWCLCGNVGKVRNAGMRARLMSNMEDQSPMSFFSSNILNRQHFDISWVSLIGYIFLR